MAPIPVRLRIALPIYCVCVAILGVIMIFAMCTYNSEWAIRQKNRRLRSRTSNIRRNNDIERRIALSLTPTSDIEQRGRRQERSQGGLAVGESIADLPPARLRFVSPSPSYQTDLYRAPLPLYSESCLPAYSQH